jgi:hypothetical protein
MPGEKFDASVLQAMFDTTRIAMEARDAAMAVRSNLVIPPLLPDRFYRHVITDENSLYTGNLHTPAPMPERAIGLVAFAGKLVIPIFVPKIRNELLLQPLTPYPDANRNQLRQQRGSLVRYIGLSQLALANQLEVVSRDDAHEEVRDNPAAIFNPERR